MQSPQIQIHNADCYAHIANIPDKSVDLIITDPPYLLSGLKSGFAKEAGGGNYAKLIEKHNTLGKGFDFSLLKEFERIQPTLNAYIFCNQKLLKKLLCYYDDKEHISTDILIWHKPNARPQPRNLYDFDCEFILFLQGDINTLDTTQSGFSSHIFSHNLMNNHNKHTNHPTEKPLSLIENLVLNSSKEGDLVLDCFSGSGTSAQACKILNRNFLGYEIDKEYYEQSIKRLNQTQGRLAI